MNFIRYAIYFTPAPGPLATFGAGWLGWDILTRQIPRPPSIPELANIRQNITRTPGRYGFHATIKPPFRLAQGQSEADLCAGFEALCAGLKPVKLKGLALARLGRFLALVPEGDTSALGALASHAVRDLDPFRAPLTDAEIAKRRANNLNAEQDALLPRWGYPYVMDAFRFHMTLTEKMPKTQAKSVQDILESHVMPHVPRPFDVDALSLVGEDTQGRFHLIQRLALQG
ncbi:DUF1045 domain-containing protein [Roseovarius rhodophyticola]|uniref:DUF1045 domain-containing protein n=1 Tax=Roseovarius rhodophyticola TaxID=3080827 RepID=A0ABZ2TB70_9RHOB|nr:DUF1045 domain-containing protein [Roseovarius sp. W115]MDV2930615.1 DUF1045 domain-containing protein [Roseovarius sp. W115]